jgi:CMP-N-acetylneuraminic acid synthetase
MNILGVATARGGSVRMPNKNLRRFLPSISCEQSNKRREYT